MVVAPLSVINSWVKHWHDWSNLNVIRINNKDRDPFLEAIDLQTHDVYICHWPVLRLMPELRNQEWFHIIGDEVHFCQNRKSQQTKALKNLSAKFKTGLSGTPAYDKPDDLWSVLNWLYPHHWSNFWKYYHTHVDFVDFNGYKTPIGVKNEAELQEQMKPFYISRKKHEVVDDLPDKYYTQVNVDLTPRQRKAYNSMRDDMLAWIGEHEDEPVNANIVIAQLTRLQQFAIAYADVVDNKVILSDPSTKIDAVMDIISSTGRPVVVFSQFAQAIKLLGQRLERNKISHGLYMGETPVSSRDKIVDDFQNGKLRVFAGTISAGGVGITLTASDTAIFIDRAWSHSMNRQSEDRLHRITQKNAVQIIDIVADGTIDSKRIDAIDFKWSMIKKLLGDHD